MFGVIGGSSLGRLQSLEVARDVSLDTPFGRPSCPVLVGRMGRTDVAFIARHGRETSIPPHLINYRANIWSLKSVGVDSIIAVAAVGGIDPELVPGSLLVPDQIIDYTWGRESTFWAIGEAPLHIDFTLPYSRSLRKRLIETADRLAIPVVDHGTYAITQGPRLESAAEIRRLRIDGGSVVGMTGMPEAALAREAGLKYATIAVVVNHAAGVGGSADSISLEALGRISRESSSEVEKLIFGVCNS